MPNFMLEGCCVAKETEKALKVVYEGEEVWIPKSQIVEDESDELSEGDTGTLVIPVWLAKEKGIDG